MRIQKQSFLTKEQQNKIVKKAITALSDDELLEKIVTKLTTIDLTVNKLGMLLSDCKHDYHDLLPLVAEAEKRGIYSPGPTTQAVLGILQHAKEIREDENE